MGKPLNISSSKHLQSKGLDTPPGVRLAGNEASDYTRARANPSVRRLNKAEYNLYRLSTYH